MGTLAMFVNSFNIISISEDAGEFLTEEREGSMSINSKKAWCKFSYKPDNRKERVFTSEQFDALSKLDGDRGKSLRISILINYCKAKPLDAFFISKSRAFNLIAFEGITESEKHKLFIGLDAKLKKNAKFFTNSEFIEFCKICYVTKNDGQIVRALHACAFEHFKHRRFTPTSFASKFMVDKYFPELSNQNRDSITESHLIEALTNSPETTLTEEFLQQMAHRLGYRILSKDSKALNNIRQLSAGSKPYKMCHNIDFNTLNDLIKTKARSKTETRKKARDIVRQHFKDYGITKSDFITISQFVICMRERFSKDECYAAFCFTGDSNLKGTYPNNLLNITRRIWFMYFSLIVKLQGRPMKTAIKDAMENAEIRSYWERRKNKPICNYDALKANAANIRIEPSAVQNIDNVPMMVFLKEHYNPDGLK